MATLAVLKQRFQKLAKQLDAELAGQETGSLVPWAYCPRPVFLAKWIINHFEAGEVDTLQQVWEALRNEVNRRPEFLRDESVQAAKGIAQGLAKTGWSVLPKG